MFRVELTAALDAIGDGVCDFRNGAVVVGGWNEGVCAVGINGGGRPATDGVGGAESEGS